MWRKRCEMLTGVVRGLPFGSAVGLARPSSCPHINGARVSGRQSENLVGGKPPPLFIFGEARSGKPDRTAMRQAAKKFVGLKPKINGQPMSTS
ncbi:MAG TPA: hypothetical protein PKC89_07930 [Pyrinomonadaceae bacterium]|nr:hypothetical protein [Pyrinomonadaceae bacterium]